MLVDTIQCNSMPFNAELNMLLHLIQINSMPFNGRVNTDLIELPLRYKLDVWKKYVLLSIVNLTYDIYSARVFCSSTGQRPLRSS